MAKKKTKKQETRIITLQVEVFAPSYVSKRRVAKLIGRCIEVGIGDAIQAADDGEFHDPDVNDVADMQLLRSTLPRKPRF